MTFSKHRQNQGSHTTHRKGQTSLSLSEFLDLIPVRQGNSPTNNPQTPCCPRIQLNPDTIPWSNTRCHRFRAPPHKTAIHFRCHKPSLSPGLPTNQLQIGSSNHLLPGDGSGWHSQVQVITCSSDQLLMYQRFPRPPPWVQLIC